MPLIGVTNCRKIEDYRQSVLHVGGEVRLLEPTAELPSALQGLDGVLLTGGGDVSPARYGEAPHPTFDEAEPGRDEFELALVSLARDGGSRSWPSAAACRCSTSRAAARSCRTSRRRCRARCRTSSSSSAPGLRIRARGLDRQGHDALQTHARAVERHRRVRGQQPSSSGHPPAGARAHRVGHGARRGHRSDRRPAAGFCLGVQWHRKTSGGPANFARCLRGCWKPTAGKSRSVRLQPDGRCRGGVA